MISFVVFFGVRIGFKLLLVQHASGEIARGDDRPVRANVNADRDRIRSASESRIGGRPPVDSPLTSSINPSNA